MHPPWEIRVGRKDKILAEFRVPAHKLQKNALYAFLKAMVVRYRTETSEDMLAFYVNKAHGAPNPTVLRRGEPLPRFIEAAGWVLVWRLGLLCVSDAGNKRRSGRWDEIYF
jgi:hypothetical protein